MRFFPCFKFLQQSKKNKKENIAKKNLNNDLENPLISEVIGISKKEKIDLSKYFIKEEINDF